MGQSTTKITKNSKVGQSIIKNTDNSRVGKSTGLVAQSVMSATDTLGHWDVHGLSAIDPCPRQWICICTMPKDVGIPL